MKLRFTEMDFVIFKNAKELYDAIFTNINRCLSALVDMRDDLQGYAQQQLGAKAQWRFKPSGNFNSTARGKRAGKYGYQEMYFAQDIEISRVKPARQFFINVEYTYEKTEFKDFVFWWQIGQSDEQIRLGLLFDESLLHRLKVTATKASAKCYLASEDPEAEEGLSSIYIALPVNLASSAESLLDQHRLFKNTIVKPMLHQL